MSDMIRGDFFEEDEPIAEMKAVWARGVKRRTVMPETVVRRDWMTGPVGVNFVQGTAPSEEMS